MREINFTIFGNQENRLGNPIGYTRTTQRSRFNERSRRYEAWKAYVACAYRNSVEKRVEIAKDKNLLSLIDKKPIQQDKATVLVQIYYVDEKHPDPDNTIKGILDALFKNDKHVNVITQHFCRNAKPRVEVKILI